MTFAKPWNSFFALSAKIVGVIRFAGVSWSSRAKFWHSEYSCPVDQLSVLPSPVEAEEEPDPA